MGKIVKTRKPFVCAECFRRFEKGEKAYVVTEKIFYRKFVYHGHIHTRYDTKSFWKRTYYCLECAKKLGMLDDEAFSGVIEE